MPMTFQDNWNELNLAKLKLLPVADGEDPALGAGNIARFWKAKARMKKQGPVEVARLTEEIAVLDEARTAKEANPNARFTGKMAADLKAATDKRTTISNALARGKVTSAMVKNFAPELTPGLTNGNARNLDPVMERIHNDRLRLADGDMLKAYDGVAVRKAIVAAKPRFTQDVKVAAMFARAVAVDGDPITITQGVHQSDDPHFDVRVSGEAQQYHVEVTLGKPLVIRSVSYMLGPRQADGSRRVGQDGEPVVDTV